jgi:hypothetical protein
MFGDLYIVKQSVKLNILAKRTQYSFKFILQLSMHSTIREYFGLEADARFFASIHEFYN